MLAIHLSRCLNMLAIHLSRCLYMLAIHLSRCLNMLAIHLSRCLYMLAIHLSICLYMLAIHLSICLFMLAIHLSICLYMLAIHLSICLYMLAIHLSIYLYMLAIHLSICLYMLAIHLSICLSFYLSLCFWMRYNFFFFLVYMSDLMSVCHMSVFLPPSLSVISNDPPCKDGNSKFTTMFLMFLFSLKLFIFICGFSAEVTCAILVFKKQWRNSFSSQKNGCIFQIFDQIKVPRVTF